MSEPLGYVIKSLSHRNAIAISRRPLPVGEYVSASFKTDDPIRGEKSVTVLGVVSLSSHLPAIPESVMKYVNPGHRPVASALKYVESLLHIVAQVDQTTGNIEPPRYPIPPDTPLMSADPELLSKIYGSKRGIVRLGVLAPRELGVEIKVDPNKLAKHLFIAGATGSGKSNTVAILADRLSQIGAPVIIFDVHGEYSITPEDGNVGRVIKVSAKINPLTIPPKMMASIIIEEPQARRQRRALAVALRDLKKEIEKIKKEGFSTEEAVLRLHATIVTQKRREVEDEELNWNSSRAVLRFKELLECKVSGQYFLDEKLEKCKTGDTQVLTDGRQKETVVDKIEEFFENTPITLQEDPIVARARNGTILVVDSSELTDEQKRWVLKVLADSVLERLKTARGTKSIVLVVEEAPLFLDRDLKHPVKQSLQRLAREGRKFGACLIVVSQRPRSLDVNVVSQLQNFVFLRMVQREDIETVMNIADSLDESLASIIPSLPDGRAIIMGEWVGRFPALVDIDLHKGKRVGATPNLVELWDRGTRTEDLPSFPLEPF
ncbi:MAG: ATP-binding protein [Acidilobaceae archaeon]